MRRICLLLVIAACSKSDPAPATHEDRHAPATAAAQLHLAIIVDGATSVWSEAQFAAAAKLAGSASDGEARDTWSLRELVRANVGPTARVVAVAGADGRTPIDRAAWDDPKRTPILHTTRRGTLKFRWADPAGAWGETVRKDVTTLEIAQ